MIEKVKKNIFIAISIFVLLYLAFSVYGNFSLVIDSIKNFNWIYFPLILLVVYFSILLKYLRWQYYLNLLNIDLEYRISFQIFMASLVMGVTPGKIGDLIKSYMIKEINETPVSKTVPIVFAERVTEFMALVLLVTVGLLLLNQNILIIIISLLVILILFILLFNDKSILFITNKLSKISSIEKYIEPLKLSLSSSKFLLKPKPFSLMLIFSLIIWLVEGLGFYLILFNFNIDLSVIHSFFTYLFSIFIGSVSMLPAGLGITDGSLAFLLSEQGIKNEIAITATLITRIATLWFSLLIGIISMIGFNKFKNRNNIT